MVKKTESDAQLISQMSSIIEGLLVQIAQGELEVATQIIEQLNELHQYICMSSIFSALGMLQYTRYCTEFNHLTAQQFNRKIPTFFDDDYLDSRFLSNPSDYGIVLALAVKSWKCGQQTRAKQLLKRVASSRFKERELAAYYITKYFEILNHPAPEVQCYARPGSLTSFAS